MINNKTIRQVIINKALLPCTPGELEYHEIATAAGDQSVSFTTNVVGDIKDLHVDIVPKQSGSGDPSPDNIRPITGTDLLKFGYGPIPATGPIDVIDIPLSETVYAGFYDEETGELENQYAIVDLSSFEWQYESNYQRFKTTTQLSDVKASSNNNTPINGICSIFKLTTSNNTASLNYDNVIGVSTGMIIQIRDTSLNGDVNALTALLSGQKLCYELATPVKVSDITPVEIKTLKGKQKIQSSNKFGFSLKYPIMVGGSCDIAKQFMPIFYPSGKGVNHNGSTF